MFLIIHSQVTSACDMILVHAVEVGQKRRVTNISLEAFVISCFMLVFIHTGCVHLSEEVSKQHTHLSVLMCSVPPQ